MAFLLSAGAFLSSKAIEASADRLVGFFDIQDTNGVARYETFFSGTSTATTTVDNATFLAMDVLHHTFVIGGYYMIAAALAYMPYLFIQYSFKPETVELPDYATDFNFFGSVQKNLFPMMGEMKKNKM